jgi:hypothetical protein
MKVAAISALALAGSASAFVPAAPRSGVTMKADGKFQHTMPHWSTPLMLQTELLGWWGKRPKEQGFHPQ